MWTGPAESQPYRALMYGNVIPSGDLRPSGEETAAFAERAVAALDQREQVLGITLPNSLREFDSVEGARALLTEHSNDDEAVPIERLGDPEALAHGFLKIQDENQGVAAWYVRPDGSDDPPVEVGVECEGVRLEAPEGVDDPSFWDVAVSSACRTGSPPSFTNAS